MEKLKRDEMLNVKGGSSVTAAMLNAIIRGITTMYTIGQAVGSAIRRAMTGSYC